MRIATTRFGSLEHIEVPDDQIYEFYPGLGGFEDDHRYALIVDDESVVRWLQSLAKPAVCFPLLEPALVVPGYAFELPDADAEALGVEKADEVQVHVVVSLRDPLTDSTANLMAPVLTNPGAGLGRQVVLQDSGHPLRYRVFAGLDLTIAPEQLESSDDEREQAERAA